MPPPDDPITLERWTALLAARLDVPELAGLDPAVILDLARDAAHGIARPAAPLTTFLVGYAAGVQDGGDATVRRLATEAARWAREQQGTSGQKGRAEDRGAGGEAGDAEQRTPRAQRGAGARRRASS